MKTNPNRPKVTTDIPMEGEKYTTIDDVIDEVRAEKKGLKIIGLSGSSAPYLAVNASIKLERSLLYITTKKRFEDAASDLEFFTRDAPNSVTFLPFPSWDFAPYDRLSPQIDTSITRIRTLFTMAKREAPFVVAAPIQSIMSKIMPRHIIDSPMTLSLGDEVEKDEIVRFLLSGGYTQTGMVTVPGSFSQRGGIIDFFGPSNPSPVRVEFYGDTVDSIRTFDPHTQRSISEIKNTEIVCASELVLSKDNIKRGVSWIRKAGAEIGTPIKRIREIVEDLHNYRMPSGLETHAGAFYGGSQTLFDYLPLDALIFIEEPEPLLSEAEDLSNLAHDNFLRAQEKKDPSLPPEKIFLSPEEISGMINRRGAVFLNPTILSHTDEIIRMEINNHNGLRDRISKTKKGEPILSPLAEEIYRKRSDGNIVALVCLTESQGMRMSELLSSYGVELPSSHLSFNLWISEGGPPTILIGGLRKGFEDPSRGIVLITEEEIFGAKVKIKRSQRYDLGDIFTTPVDDLTPGDFIVHSRFGIGKYEGLVNLKVMEIRADFLHLEYDDGDKLYIPVDKISELHRYKSHDGASPKLEKLGGVAWERSKKKVRKSIFEMANELAKLYAQRKALPGRVSTPPGRDFGEFEATFSFEETPDQLQAIEDIIADMTKSSPMDRLIAGDVGYGKTEVAIRAAFMAVMDGSQVALIVPTTILAEQHYNTFSERFKDYPVNIKMLSRFLSAKKQKEVIKRLSDGTVDIVIGTHRLLSKDIEFSNLGLLIIDEEHRFGVTHKEKLVKIKTQLDVISMTATPIPRTLSMSLTGLRDLSVINTPPPNRLSVKTYISEFDPDVIKEATLREISRGGQVFFVHNRVQTIAAKKRYLETLLPNIRIGVAHGQMNEDELERIMIDFVDKKIDILVSTSIIESGLDIPSANTIIINRAETFGLAQLYQMRGRVGRSNLQAYAYLLISSPLSLTPEAKKRLKVICEFSDLGSGIKIAEHDLEIRGAGNLLGRHQSGHINQVGYEMYMKMVEEAIREIKGEEERIEIDPDINLPVSAFIPENYINDSNLRLTLYRRLINAEDEGRLKDLSTEISDRFGPPPDEVKDLLGVMEVRLLAKKALITGLRYKNRTVNMTFHHSAKLDTEKIVSLVMTNSDKFGVTPDGILKFQPHSTDKSELLVSLKNILQILSPYVKK